MQLVNGETLAERVINQGPLPQREIAKIVASIARAVALP